MRSAACPARGTGPAHRTPPQPRSPPVPPWLRRAPRGGGGGRSWRGSRPGRWLPSVRVGKVDPRRAGAAPAAPRGWAPAAAESEPPEIPVPIIARWPRTGVPAERSLPSALLPVPGRHAPLPRVPRDWDCPAVPGLGAGRAPRPAPVPGQLWVGGQRPLAGRWTRPTPPRFDPGGSGSSSVKYGCFQAPNLWIREAVPKGVGIYRAGELF